MKEVLADKARLVALREGVTPDYVRRITSGSRAPRRGKGKEVLTAACDYDQMIADFLSKKAQPGQ